MKYLIKPDKDYEDLIFNEIHKWVQGSMCRVELIPDSTNGAAPRINNHHHTPPSTNDLKDEFWEFIKDRKEITTNEAWNFIKKKRRGRNSVYNTFKRLEKEGRVKPSVTSGKGVTAYVILN